MNNYLFSNPYGTNIIKAGQVVSRSKNLRGLLTYNRRAHVVRVEIKRDDSNPFNGRLFVTYADGATCSAFFSDFRVLVSWVERRRIFKNAEMVQP
jgi:hypothetical protein